jgi:tetratricopeptide (TPR) repeat protein
MISFTPRSLTRAEKLTLRRLTILYNEGYKDPMTNTSVQLPGRPFKDWIRDIYVYRKTGLLALAEDSDDCLFFVAGDLYLSPEHPLFEQATGWIASPTSFKALAIEILKSIPDPTVAQTKFREGAAQIRIDLAGPLPTSQLIMETTVWNADEKALLRQLGGEETILVVSAASEPLPPNLDLDPHEAFLLSRLESPQAVGELLHQLDLNREEVLQRLCRLLSINLVRQELGTTEEPGVTGQSTELLARFLERIGESLEREPLALDESQHRQLLKNLIARIGEISHFELLAVGPQSTDDEIHQGYFELGRLVHPSQAPRLGLQGKEGTLQILFERATDAYLTLSDPERKTRYANEISSHSQTTADDLSDDQRREEIRSVARESYQSALSLAERHDYHSAIQLLEQAVKVDPQPEYLALLGDCQAENPKWLDRAAANYGRAVRSRPNDPFVRIKLGRVLERQGEPDRARQEYETALELAPEQPEAIAGLERIGVSISTPSKRNLADRLRAWLNPNEPI